MALTPEQISQMDAVVGGGSSSSLSPDMVAQMDAALSDQPQGSSLERFGKGVYNGVGQAGLGVAQLAGTLFRPVDDNSYLAKKIDAGQQNLQQVVDASKQDVAKLGTAGQAGELVGNIAGSAPFVAMTGPEAAVADSTGTLARMGASALTGATGGAMQAVGSEDSRLKNMGVAAAGAGLLQGAADKIVSPAVEWLTNPAAVSSAKDLLGDTGATVANKAAEVRDILLNQHKAVKGVEDAAWNKVREESASQVVPYSKIKDLQNMLMDAQASSAHPVLDTQLRVLNRFVDGGLDVPASTVLKMRQSVSKASVHDGGLGDALDGFNQVLGDSLNVKSLPEALAASTDRFAKFHDQKAVAQAIAENATPETVGHVLMTNRNQAADVFDQVLKAAGDQAPQAEQVMQQGMVHNLLQGAIKTTGKDGTPVIDTASLSDEINLMRRNNPSLWGKFNAQQQKALIQFAVNLKKSQGGLIKGGLDLASKFLPIEAKATINATGANEMLRPSDALPLNKVLDLMKVRPESGPTPLDAIKGAAGKVGNAGYKALDATSRGLESLGVGGDQSGMLYGVFAENADQVALREAKTMLKAGASREDIWNKTGWFQGVDGQWKFEVSDHNALPFDEIGPHGKALPDMFMHDELYKNYPDIKDKTWVRQLPSTSREKGMISQDEYGNFSLGLDNAGNRSTMLHELQHAVQNKEGFARGGNVKSQFTANELDDAYTLRAMMEARKIDPHEAIDTFKKIVGREPDGKAKSLFTTNTLEQIKGLAGDYKAYMNNAGEAEARLVQRRMDMTPEQRKANPPWSKNEYGYDVPEDKQVVSFEKGKYANKDLPTDTASRMQLARSERAKKLGDDFRVGVPSWYMKPSNLLQFKTPVSLSDGTRLSGFNDEAQTVFYGYDKNGNIFTKRANMLLPEEIVPNQRNAKLSRYIRNAIANKINKDLTNDTASTKLAARPEATALALGVAAGGLKLGDFASSVATNTQYNPAVPEQDKWTYDPTLQSRQDANTLAMKMDRAEQATPEDVKPSAGQSDSELQQFMQQQADQKPVNPLEAYADKAIQAESGGRATVKAKTSSATGAGQFIKSTWLHMVDKHMPELKQFFNTKEILNLRNDPQVSRKMTIALAVDNAKHLAAKGAPVTEGSLYLSHVVGADTAAKLFKVDPRTPLDRIISPSAIRANARIMKGKRAGDLIAYAESKMQ